jgi:hypothetical protein
VSARWVGNDPPPHIADGRPLVGPMVRFRGGPVAVDRSAPTNTGDPRYRACTDHHLACDCREADLNEQLHEYRSEWQLLRDEMGRAIRGHATVVEQEDGQPRIDLQCQCALCEFARVAGLVPNRWAREVSGQGNYRVVFASHTRGT